MRRPTPALKSALDGIKPGQILEHIKVLASDEFEGRGPGTPGEEKTVAYLTGQFQKMGLKPGNPDGTFVQDVPLVGFQAKQVTGAFQAAAAAIGLSFPNDFVAVSRRMAEEVKVENSDVVFVGYGVVAPEYGWDDYKGLDVRGKTLIMLVNDPPVADPKDPVQARPGRLQGPGDDVLRALDVQVRDRLGERGGGRDPGPRDRPGRVSLRGRQGKLEPRELRHRPAADAARHPSRVAVEGWITRSKAKELFQAAGRDFDALKKAAAQPRFPAGAARNARPGSRSPTPCARSSRSNVVARLEGSDPALKNETADLHRPLGPPGPRPGAEGRPDLQRGRGQRLGRRRGARNRPRVHPGRSRPPKRSILFLAVTAEEKGLLGAKYYAAHPLYPLERTLADINLDVINLWGPTNGHHQHRHGQLDARRPARRDRRRARPDGRPRRRSGEGLLLPLRPLRVRQARRARARSQGGPAIHRQVRRLRPAKARRVHGEGLSQGQRRGEARLGPFRRRRGHQAPGRARAIASPREPHTPSGSPAASSEPGARPCSRRPNHDPSRTPRSLDPFRSARGPQGDAAIARRAGSRWPCSRQPWRSSPRWLDIRYGWITPAFDASPTSSTRSRSWPRFAGRRSSSSSAGTWRSDRLLLVLGLARGTVAEPTRPSLAGDLRHRLRDSRGHLDLRRQPAAGPGR